MRFSTRNTHKRGKAVALAASAAVLGIGGIVSQIYHKDAAAETSSVDNNIFYANTADYTSINDAAAAASTALRVEQATFCNVGSGVGGAVTRVNPYTGESSDYWVFAKYSSQCPSSAVAPDKEILLTDNGTTVLTQEKIDNAGSSFYGSTSENFYNHYNNAFGILGAFHIMSFYNTDTAVQAYGNVATRYLESVSNNNIDHFDVPTLSYIQNMNTQGNISSFNNVGNNDKDTSVLVVGKDVNIRPSPNNGFWENNGATVNSPTKRSDSEGNYLDNVWQEYEGGPQFLDFKEIKDTAINYSETLRQYPDTLVNGTDYDLDTLNQQYVRIADDNGLNVVSINSASLTSENDNVYVWGFDQHKDSTLLVNIDIKDAEMHDGHKYLNILENWHICYDDASKLDESKYNGETSRNGGSAVTPKDNGYCLNQSWYKDKYPNQIILNFFDSTADPYSYDADRDDQNEYYIDFKNGMTAATIAPRGKVLVSVTPYQGIIIANNVEINAGDTYFLSFSDNLPLAPNECSYTIKHVNKTTGEVFESYTVNHSGLCEDQSTDEVTTISPESDILANSFVFVGAKYEDNGESSPMVFDVDDAEESTQTVVDNGTELDKGFAPYGIWNDLESKTITFYYKKNCTVTVEHREDGTMTELAPTETYTGFCGELSETIDLARSVLDEYDFTEGIEIESDTKYTSASEFPLQTGIVNSDQHYILEYEKKETPPTPDTCSIEIHHYIVNTTTPVDDDISMTQTCGNIEMILDISEKALNNGYKFVSGKMESERYLDDYTEEDFPMSITNNFPSKVYTLYYEKTDTPDVPTPDVPTPDTRDNSPILILSAAGAIIGLGTATMFIARRRQ